MAQADSLCTITVMTACMTAVGTPDFIRNQVQVTPEEIANGAHYYLVEEKLLEDGYEEPFVHFDEREAAEFLIPAIRQYFGLLTTTSREVVSTAKENP